MIYKYHFKNAWSFAEETEVSFMLNRHAPDTDSVFTTPRGVRLSKLMAVQGANGAGKSNVLKVVSFLSWFISDSFSSQEHLFARFASYFLTPLEDSEFKIEFEHKKEHYRYHVIVQTSGKKRSVIHESLYRKTSTSFSYMFRRDRTESGYKIRQKNFDFDPKEAARVRSDASLISTAAQYNVPCAVILANYFEQIRSNINTSLAEEQFHSIESFFAAGQFYFEHPNLHKKMVKFMSQADLGLSDVAMETKDGTWGNYPIRFPWGIHEQGKENVKINFMDESGGTQMLYLLLQKILPVLERGGIVVLDELDSGLHPDMVMALLGLFTDTEGNPHNAQIIFTSYIPDVMDTLLKEQILLVEKRPDGCSEAWRLDDINGIRRDENYYGKYRAGAYGATPNI